MTASSVSARSVLFCASLVLAFVVAAGDGSAAERPKGADESAQLLAEQVCASCHGPRGLSTLQDIPILASQKDVYIAAKLWQFRNQSLRRPEQHLDLLGIVLIDDATVESLAHYFATQPAPPPIARDAALVEQGRVIFNRGVAEKGIGACAMCHGANAEGLWIVPRLAGQHARYVERQMRVIQLQLRKTRVMHGAINGLSPDEIVAVAAFVQSK